jgi:glutathione S-transferase
MELPRMMLAVAGKFPGADYVDGRFSGPPEGLEANLGRMPILERDGQSVGQSAAINFYVASEFGLLGANAMEAARILSIQEHVKELMTEFRKVAEWGKEPDAEKMNQWFDGGATDATGPADGSQRGARFLTWWLTRIEATLDNTGFAVGNQISMADVLFYTVFADSLTDAEAGELPKYRRESFTDQARTDAKIAQFPKLNATIAAVRNHPNLQKWLATRGPQMF